MDFFGDDDDDFEPIDDDDDFDPIDEINLQIFLASLKEKKIDFNPEDIGKNPFLNSEAIGNESFFKKKNPKKKMTQEEFLKPHNEKLKREKEEKEKLEIRKLNKEFLKHCQKGEIENAKEKLNQGANDIEGGFCCASSGGHKELSLYLIEKGAKNFENAIVQSCKSGNLTMLKFLLIEGSKRGLLYTKNLKEGLKEAKLKKHSNCAFFLINLLKSDTPKLIFENPSFNEVNSGLLKAVQSNDLEKIKFFISKGASKLNQALKSACACGRKEIAEYLISQGAQNIDASFLKACTTGSDEMIFFSFGEISKEY